MILCQFPFNENYASNSNDTETQSSNHKAKTSITYSTCPHCQVQDNNTYKALQAHLLRQ